MNVSGSDNSVMEKQKSVRHPLLEVQNVIRNNTRVSEIKCGKSFNTDMSL